MSEARGLYSIPPEILLHNIAKVNNKEERRLYSCGREKIYPQIMLPYKPLGYIHIGENIVSGKHGHRYENRIKKRLELDGCAVTFTASSFPPPPSYRPSALLAEGRVLLQGVGTSRLLGPPM